MFGFENQKYHASRTRLGQSRLFHYEHVLIQSVAAQSQVYCQQQHVVGRARKVRNSGSRLVVRELSLGPCLAPIVRGLILQGMMHIR